MDGVDRERAAERAERADAWPSVKQRTGVQQAVRRVLDALAPERPPARGAEPPVGAVQRYRSPRGCILQGDAWAVTVSWFPASDTEHAFGELQVISWLGVVSRPGATRRAAGGARPVSEELLSPVESSGDEWSWRATDGTVLASGAVVERCLHLLERRAARAGAGC
jgi:hypothetical protein